MAITTLKGHVSRAMDFFHKPDIYFMLGRTTPWDDENNPPVPNATDEIEEVLGYKKVESIFMVVPDNSGTLVYRNTKWKIVPLDQALAKGARWVYISSYLTYEELPLESYRQIGITTKLVKKAGVAPGKMNLLPTEVADAGILEVINNRKPIYRQTDLREQLVMVLEF